MMRTAAVLSVLLTLGAGCGPNLAAVREFAAISSESAAYTKLTSDYAETPLRLKRYQPASRHAELDRLAADRKPQREQLILRHRLIEQYMDALGQLAADEAVVFDKEIKGLGEAAKNAKFVDPREADAFAAVTRVLLTAAADGWRRRQLRDLVAAANRDLQVVVGALRTIFVRDFVDDAANERKGLNKFYEDLLAASRDKAGVEALREWQELRREAIEARERAIKAYAAVLEKIGQGHQRLYDARNDVAAAPVLADLKRYGKDVRDLFAVVRERL